MTTTTSIENNILKIQKIDKFPRLLEIIEEYSAELEAGYQPSTELLSEMFLVIAGIETSDSVLADAIENLGTAIIEDVLLRDEALADNPALASMLTTYAGALDSGYDPGLDFLLEVSDVLSDITTADPALQAALDDLAQEIGETLPDFDAFKIGTPTNEAIFGDLRGPFSQSFAGLDHYIDGNGGRDFLVGDLNNIYTNAYGVTAQGGDDWIVGNGSLYGDFVEITYGYDTTATYDAIGGNDTIISVNFPGSASEMIGDFGMAIHQSYVMAGTLKGGDDLLIGDPNSTLLNIMVGDVSMINEPFGDGGTIECGDDTLVSGGGNDLMAGDAMGYPYWGATIIGGYDTFVFAPGSGIDQIRDFEHGKDKIDISAYGYTAADFAALVSLPVPTLLVVDLDGTADDIDEINVSFDQMLTADDFIFA